METVHHQAHYATVVATDYESRAARQHTPVYDHLWTEGIGVSGERSLARPVDHDTAPQFRHQREGFYRKHIPIKPRINGWDVEDYRIRRGPVRVIIEQPHLRFSLMSLAA